MVDYPTASAVGAFRAPPTPQQTLAAARAAARLLDDVFNPAPRRPMLPQRRGRGFKPHPRAFGLGLIQDTLTPVDELVPAGIQADAWLHHGWTLVAGCADHQNCCTGCNGTNTAINRRTGYSIHAHSCCAFTPQGVAFTPGADPGAMIQTSVALDMGRRQGPFNWVAWSLWWERPLFMLGKPQLSPNRVDAWRWRKPDTRTARRAASRVTGTGRVRTTTRFPFKPRRPPRKHERETKLAPRSAAVSVLVRLLEGILEGGDIVEAIHGALPKSCQGGKSLASQVSAISSCYESINWSTALENLIDNQIEDWFFGQFGKLTKAEAQAQGRPRGLQAKPATIHGGWSPCLFCN